MAEQAKFTYSTLGKAFKNKQKQIKKWRKKTSLGFMSLKTY